ncbi:MAG: aminotransferase class IV [Bacteroidota bacterium]
MNHTPIHNFFIFNGELKPVSDFIPSENDGGVYEVLRVVKGIPLFSEEHMERFFASAALAGKAIRYEKLEILSFIQKLISANKVLFGNILISCKVNLKAFFIAHQYPKASEYKTGVKCGILHGERQNPNAKIFHTNVRHQADKLIAAKGYYEVMLVDQYNRVTEGSRSNVFLVNENVVVTPPGNEVLLGITRQKTIQLAKESGLVFEEHDVFLSDIANFQAVFITGTSPKILPVSQIENLKFDPQNNVMQFLIKSYEKLILEYISKNN